MEAETTNTFKNFIKVRPDFENLLLKYDYLIQEINRKYRQAISSYIFVKDFYVECIKILGNGKTVDETIAEIVKTKKFNYLKIDATKADITSAEFTTERKSAVFIKEALATGLRCSICNGLIHLNSITIDHKDRKEDGGLGSIDNGQLAHPYCNSTVKN